MGNNSENKKIKSRWLVVAVFFLIIVFGLAGLVIGFEKAYAQKIYPNIKLGYLNVGGMTKEQALEQLQQISSNLREQGLKFIAEDKEITIDPIVMSAADPDLAKPILTFNWEESVNNAYQLGRNGNFLSNILNQLGLLVSGQRINVSYNLNREELINTLKANFSEMEKQPVNAQLKINGDQVEVSGEQSGYIFNYEKAADQVVANVESLDFQPVAFDLVFTEPEIKKDYTGSAVNSIEKILSIEELKLNYPPYWWKIEKSQFVDWLEFQLVDNEIVVGFNKEKILEFLDPIAKAINVEARDAKFEMSGDRVTKFQSSQDGKTLDMEKAYEQINQQIIAGNNSDIELPVKVVTAKITTGDLNDLGIKELIGVGKSNFAGSPANRRHNIATGAAALNGILIQPDEEFSLLDALGEIDGEHGYKQELVIKGNRTIPEYGGGLCQIGTTTFRAALRSGLPITMRRNHSYRVVYYEPAGMDATIYDPAPDMKFINDTGYNILFTTRIEGDELIFEFYGTKDGRKVLINPDPPSIFNISSPGAPRYIETEELAPGEKKKIESAHNGADTYFKYTVTYPNGEVKEQDFNSHYVAWPEVWLVGKEPVIESTTTEEIIL